MVLLVGSDLVTAVTVGVAAVVPVYLVVLPTPKAVKSPDKTLNSAYVSISIP